MERNFFVVVHAALAARAPWSAGNTSSCQLAQFLKLCQALRLVDLLLARFALGLRKIQRVGKEFTSHHAAKRSGGNPSAEQTREIKAGRNLSSKKACVEEEQ